MRKITSLKGKKITDVRGSGMYVTLILDRGGQITIRADAMFDRDGNRFDDDAPPLVVDGRRK